MTLPVYSSQVFLGALPPSWGTIYAVPAGHVLSVKDVSLHGSSVGGRVQLGAQSGSGGGSTIFIDQANLADTVYTWVGTVVLNAGDEIVANGGAGGATGIISGFLLTAT